ncbi:transposase [Aestuariivirga sp.]|uniref:transposase n=1 Tax=Aestuariivirga sp. TaxID=2650926 RepID=UPI003783A5BC
MDPVLDWVSDHGSGRQNGGLVDEAEAAESFRPGRSVSGVAKRYGATRSQVYDWRQRLKGGPEHGSRFGKGGVIRMAAGSARSRLSASSRCTSWMSHWSRSRESANPAHCAQLIFQVSILRTLSA